MQVKYLKKKVTFGQKKFPPIYFILQKPLTKTGLQLLIPQSFLLVVNVPFPPVVL